MDDIIVGVDRSETARRAAEDAAELAAAYGVNLHLVMCVDHSAPMNKTIGGDVFHVDALSEAAQHLASLALELSHTPVTHTVSFDEPARTLCDEAERLNARMIVVGNRRVQGIARVLGSVASDVARRAPCSVLIAHTTRADT
ncbi:MAG: universal stress protein [Actinomycetia bacterium]|nr:universal stress protein [Actinomycetes bacterium]